MAAQRYIIVTIEDARRIVGGDVGAFVDRMRTETGADIEEIARLLQHQEICAACSIESQESSCESIGAQKLGRRLRRLLERARGETPNDGGKPAVG